ncbi:hypothetical protein Barb4_01471 [Bacteroidales bacterium Barb4]|nr:hypothetical protein Barb4_01471 [Bacteroidales bacterium Barb4]
MLRKAPKGQNISAPHGAEWNVGLRQIHINKVLKERDKLQTMVCNAIYIIRSSLQDFLIGITINPTFRYAPCGAEISHPFGISA